MRTRRVVSAIAGASVALLMNPGVAVAQPGPVPGSTTVEFAFTGSEQTFVVPDGVIEVLVDACGGQGSAGNPAAALDFIPEYGAPGLGGRAVSRLDVTPGEALSVNVGGAGGFDGVAFGGGGSSETAGGGGASDVRRGSSLADRLIVGGGGGGAGGGLPALADIDPTTLTGGAGGGGDAASASGGGGGSAVAGGIGPTGIFGPPGIDGQLGLGGGSTSGAGAGGGGLYGGASGALGGFAWGGGGGGGSSLGDTTTSGFCSGDGSVFITYNGIPRPSVLPGGVLVQTEGDSGSTVWQLPVQLSFGTDEPVTVDWGTADLVGQGLVESGVDFEVASGSLTFAPGETTQYVELTVLGDTVDEPDLLWGEWGIVMFSNLSDNAVLDTGPFFGVGLFVIVDDDISLPPGEYTETFSFTGAAQPFEVPNGVFSIDATVCGAEGGTGDAETFPIAGVEFAAGGLGGLAESTLSVAPNESLLVSVGEAGSNGSAFGGGGSSISIVPVGGGGASDIRRGPDLASRMIVGGGGGGGGGGLFGAISDPSTLIGGAGGGGDAFGFAGGKGGSDTEGGAAATGSAGNAGSLGIGGDAVATAGAGAGGGGLYGGGSGAAAGFSGGGGGGGSSLGDITTAGVCAGNGSVVIEYSVSPSAGAVVAGE